MKRILLIALVALISVVAVYTNLNPDSEAYKANQSVMTKI